MVSGGCLEGVWRMSEGWMGVCSEWLWVSSQSFGHKYAWSNPKTRIEGMCFFLCPFSKSALRAQKGIKIQKVMLLWPAFFLTKTWWSFRQSDLFLCIGLGLGGHESNFWPCVLCPTPTLTIFLDRKIPISQLLGPDYEGVCESTHKFSANSTRGNGTFRRKCVFALKTCHPKGPK